jgi:polysaccharide chain length determinant protein (PEP-CTERM system associated)
VEAIDFMEQNAQKLYDYLELFYRRKWFLIIPLFLCTSIGAIISVSLPSYYRSTTLILVEQQQVPEAYVRPTDTITIERRLSNINEQITSRTRLEDIIKEFKLYQYAAETSSMTAIAGRMKKDIEVKVGEKSSNAFSISYIGRDPRITMQVTNALASSIIEESLKAREQIAEGTSEFLESELAKAKQNLEKQENAVRKFKEQNMGKLPEQLEANLRTLDRLQLELQSVRQIAMRNVEGALPSPFVGTLPDISLEAELERRKTDLANLLSIYTENYPDVITTKNRIKEIEAQMINKSETGNRKKEGLSEQKPDTEALGNTTNLTATTYQPPTPRQREAELIKKIKEYEKRIEGIPANEQKWLDIRRDYDMSLKNYQTLLEKKLNARLAENLVKRQKGEKFKIIDPANLPEEPYKPDRLRIALMGVAIGAGIGAGFVLLLEFLNPAFIKPEDFAGILTQPVLAIIPVFPEKAPNKLGKRFMVLNGRQR